MTHEDSKVIELTEEECLSLVGDEGVGRIGFVENGHVFVYPVNYVRDGKGIAFRTDTGSSLYRMATAMVAFEADGINAPSKSGWSVLIRGIARVVTDAVDLPEREFFRHGIVPWAPGPKAEWMRLAHPVVTGRRVGPAV